MFKKKITFYPLQNKAFGAITNLYTTLGTPIPVAAKIAYFINGTDQPLFLSTNGTDDMLLFGPGSDIPIVGNFGKPVEKNAFWPKNTQFYIKHTGTPPTSGAVYLSISTTT